MLLSRTLLLHWSHLAPSQFLACLIATARATDLVGLAEEASRQSVINKPKLEKSVVRSSKIYRHWMEDLEPAMAIAWTRCRRYVAV